MPNHNFSMYEDAGNVAAQHIFDDIKTRLKDDVTFLGQAYDEVKTGFPEVSDTAVRECLGYALAELLYEAVEYFGEGLLIDGKYFQKFFVRHCVDKQGGFAAMLREYHGVQ